ncbi:MAG: phosphoribosyltransferase [bacterium]
MDTNTATAAPPPETNVLEEEGPDHHHPMKMRQYILTVDLGEKMQLFSTLGLNVPAPEATIFVDAWQTLKHELDNILSPTAEVLVMSTKSLARDIVSKVSRCQSNLQSRAMREAFVVSTCPEIANLRGGASLQINRLIDQQGEILGIGPRPGAMPIRDQLSAIAKMAEGRPVILMEDGSFTGGTMCFILEEMKKHHIKVMAVVIGLLFSAAKQEIAKVFDGEVIVCEEKIEDPVEWMPDHDFFPFTPNSGRVFGISWCGELMPLYSRDGATFCAPYLLPFSPISKWASIPEEKSIQFSRVCLQLTRKIFQYLCDCNNRQLTIGEIIDTSPRVSIPICVGQKYLPHSDALILDYFKDCIEEID